MQRYSINELNGIIHAATYTIKEWTPILESLLNGTYKPTPASEENSEPHVVTIDFAKSVLSQYKSNYELATAELDMRNSK